MNKGSDDQKQTVCCTERSLISFAFEVTVTTTGQEQQLRVQ